MADRRADDKAQRGPAEDKAARPGEDKARPVQAPRPPADRKSPGKTPRPR